MGTDYTLVRVTHPVTNEAPLDGDFSLETAPFGSLDAVLERLRPFAVDVRRTPPFAHLHVERDGRGLSVIVTGDPVTAISVDHAAPWDLLPFVEVFADLAPLAIEDPQRGVYLDPRAVRPAAPVEAEAPASLVPPAAEGDLRPLFRLAPRAPGGFYQADVLVHGDLAYVVAAPGVTAVDAQSGEHRWTIACGRGRRYASLARGLVIVASDHPRITALDATTGAVRFEVSAPGRVCHAPVVDERGFYVGTEAGALAAFADDGSLLWMRRLEGAIYTAPAKVGDRLVVGTNEGNVYAVDLGTGEVVAEHAFPPVAVNEKTWSPSSVFGVAARGDRAVVRLDACLVELDHALVPVNAAHASRATSFDALAVAGDRVLSSFVWSPDDDAPPRTGILSLDGDLGDAVDYTGDGNLGYPAPIGGGLAFADATSGAVEIDLVGAGGAPAGRASFASSMPSWPRLTAGDGVLYVAVSDAVVAFAAP